MSLFWCHEPQRQLRKRICHVTSQLQRKAVMNLKPAFLGCYLHCDLWPERRQANQMGHRLWHHLNNSGDINLTFPERSSRPWAIMSGPRSPHICYIFLLLESGLDGLLYTIAFHASSKLERHYLLPYLGFFPHHETLAWTHTAGSNPRAQ